MTSQSPLYSFITLAVAVADAFFLTNDAILFAMSSKLGDITAVPTPKNTSFEVILSTGRLERDWTIVILIPEGTHVFVMNDKDTPRVHCIERV